MNTEKTSKRCARCGAEKPLSSFGRDGDTPDGYNYYCRDCRRKMWRDRRGGVTRLLSKFTDAELLAELQRRNLIAEKLDELGQLIAPEYETGN